MKRVTIIILALLSAIKGFSCDCLTPNTKEALKNSDVVFVGRLVEYINSSKLFSTDGLVCYSNFEVVRSYKGLSRYGKIISLINNGSNCDFRFDLANSGDTFLIYADFDYNYFSNSLITTHICKRTKLVSEIHDADELWIYKNKSEWKIPIDTKYSYRKGFKPIVQDTEYSNNKILLIAILISVLLNFILVLFILKKTFA
jgi:hypothetical protein